MLKIIKLVNGTEVMGKVVGDTPKTILLDDPVQINYKDMGQRVPSVSVTRYLQFTKKRKKVVFRRSDVAHIGLMMDAMEGFYKKAVKDFYDDIDKQVDRELRYASGAELPPVSEIERQMGILAMRERETTRAVSH